MNDKLKSIIKRYTQFEKTDLFNDIKTVLNCDDKTATKYQLTHCNMVSFWAGIKVQGYTDIEYKDFFKLMLDHEFCTESGFFNVGKDKVMEDLFGVDFDLEYYKDFEDVINPFRLDKESLYQMKIDNSMHFIICSIDDHNITLIYDSGKRGIGVPAIGSDRINEKYFKWLLRIKPKK
jgi:hypothetical protein